jgi:hypothetical protein
MSVKSRLLAALLVAISTYAATPFATNKSGQPDLPPFFPG